MRPRRHRDVPRRAGWVDALGPRRQARALAAIGWSWPALSARSSLSVHCLVDVANRERRQWVSERTAVEVDRLFNDLSMIVGPSGHAWLYASRRRWAPPLAWDDPHTDRRARGVRRRRCDYPLLREPRRERAR